MSTAAPDVRGTVFDEETSHVSRIYAEALLNVAAKSNEIEAVVTELEEIEDDILKPHPKFAELLASGTVTADEKNRILTDTFEGRALPTVLRFLKVLNHHGRLGLIAPVAQQARSLWDAKQNRRPVLVKSAVALDDDQKASIVTRIATMIGATPIPRFEVQSSLIGGLVIQDGDNLYDGSIKTKLDHMKRLLIEGKGREITTPILVD